MSKVHENTRKAGIITDHYKTTVWDDKGNKGTYRSRDKDESISEAHRKYREDKASNRN